MGERGAPRDRLLLFAFLALAAALFPRATMGAATFFHYDTGMQNLAFRAWWFAQLRAGHFATWCPGMFAGYPLFAETQTGPLYPSTFVLFSLLPPTLAFSWSVALHFAFAGAGSFLLARRLGASTTAAILAGVAFELSGFLVTHVVHFNLLVGASWAPWVALLVLRAADGRPGAALLLAAALACLLLGAHPYAVLMNTMLAGVVLVFRAGIVPRRLGLALVTLAAAATLGAALAAVQLLPARELIARTPRGAAVDWSFLTFGSFPPWGIPTLVAPDLYGTPVDGTFWGGPDWSHFAETCAYCGVLGLALAAAALALRRDLATSLFAALASLSFVLMLGRYTPVYRIVAWIPVVRSTRLPARFALLFTLALAMLAALGLDALQRERALERRRRAIGLGASLLVALAAAALVLNAPARAPDATLAGTGRLWAAHLRDVTAAAHAVSARTVVCAIASILALLPFGFARVPRWAGILPVIVLATDLFSWGRSFNPVVPAATLLQAPPAVAALPHVEPRPRIFRQGLDEMWDRLPRMPRVDLVTPAWKGHEASYATASWSLPPNSQLLYGVDSGEGFTSLPPLAWLEWMGVPALAGAAAHPSLTEGQADLLALDAVLSSGSGIVGPGWKAQALPGDLFLSRNTDPLPRVRLARSWAVKPRAELLAEVQAKDYEPRRRVLLEAAPPGWPDTKDGGPADEPIPGRELAPGRWRVEVPKGSDGIVVLAEAHDPDWRITRSDGTRLPLMRADGLFLAFAAPPEGGTVELRHAPASVARGAAISGLAILLVIAGALALRGRRWAALPPESRPGLAPWGWAVAAAVMAAVSASVDTGGVRADRREATLDAAATRSWSDEALGALQAGVPEEAARLLRAAVSREPVDAMLHYRLGVAERAAGRTQAARVEFQRALALAPSLREAEASLREEKGKEGSPEP
ncbi:MAG: hypothetical protein U0167_09335 [bacterium]